MKTSELKKNLKENGIAFDEYDTNISFITGCGEFKIYKEFKGLEIEEGIFNSDYLDFLENIIKYVKTPLEEREEEKKYYLRFPIGFNQILTYLGLSMRGYDCVGFDSSELYKKQFTQKEIDAMPFDTNFFIKEEVK